MYHFCSLIDLMTYALEQDGVDLSKLPTVPEYNEAFLSDGFRYCT
jgi:hypothetical protein